MVSRILQLRRCDRALQCLSLNACRASTRLVVLFVSSALPSARTPRRMQCRLWPGLSALPTELVRPWVRVRTLSANPVSSRNECTERHGRPTVFPGRRYVVGKRRIPGSPALCFIRNLANLVVGSVELYVGGGLPGVRCVWTAARGRAHRRSNGSWRRCHAGGSALH